MLSQILSMKAEQQRKVINLFSHTTRILLPASLYQKAQMLDLTAISLSLWPKNQQKPRKLFVPILLSARTTMKEPGHLLVFLLIFLSPVPYQRMSKY